MKAQIKASLLLDILHSVGSSEIALLSGFWEFPAVVPSDVDAIGSDEVLQNLKSLSSTPPHRAVQIIQHEATCYYWVFYRPDEQGWPVFLPLDFATDYRWGGRIFYRASDLLPHRRMESGLPLLPPALEFGYYLVKKIGKREMTARHQGMLSDLFKCDPEGCEQELARFFPDPERSVLLDAAKSRDWSPVENRLSAFRRAMLHKVAATHPWDVLSYYLGELSRNFKRIRRPTGLVVAFLGPDGSGKSTVAQRTTQDLLPAFRHAKIVHLRPSLRRRPGGGPVTDPHGQPPRGSLVSLLKLFYWWGETLLGWLIDIQPAKIRSTLVAFDRYFHDLLADPKRYRFSGLTALARFAGRFIPQPDLFLILDIPAEMANIRKPEVPLEEAHRLRQNYLELAHSLPNAHVVDSSRPLDEVLIEVENIILKHMERRLKAQLGE